MTALNQKDFKPFALKIDRAKALLKALEAQINLYANAGPYQLVNEENVLKLRITPVPDIISIVTGEIIYHLRSVLDQIAFALSRKDHLTLEEIRNIYFPAWDANDSKKYKTYKKNKEFFDPKVWEIFDLIKSDKDRNDALCGLSRLFNTDKHREIIVTAIVPIFNNFTRTSPVGTFIEQAMRGERAGLWASAMIKNGNQIMDGMIISEKIEGIHSTGDIGIPFNIQIKDMEPFNAKPLLQLLEGLALKVEETIALIQRELC